MSAPGIRALNIARVLGRALPGARVTLAALSVEGLAADEPFRAVTYTPRTLLGLAMDAEIVIAQAFPPTLLPAYAGRHFVLDFYAPSMVEGLEYRGDQVSVAAREVWLETQRVYLNFQLSLADLVLCANERQRDAWLGMMSGLGLIPGGVYDRDNTLRRLVAVAPFGVRPEPPHADPARPVVRGVVPGIGAEDQLVLWNGGILRWYDPLTLIRAVGRLAPTHPKLRLLFLGTRYPVAGFDPGGMLGEAHALARGLGLLDRHVFFNDGWLPYDESGRAMCEADVGVCTYYANYEAHLSYRIRLVDFLWSGTPLITTRVDVISEFVERRGLGLTVGERDEDGLTAALARLLDDGDFNARCRAHLAVLRPELTWERALAPLVAFCRAPRSIARGKWHRAADVGSRTARYALARLGEQARSRRAGLPLYREWGVRDGRPVVG